MKLTIDQCRAISWAVEEAVTRGYTRDADLLRTVLTEARDEFHATSHPDHSGDGGEKAAALDEVIEALKNEREIVTGSMSEYNTSDYSDRLDAKEDAINDCIARVEHMKAALASNKAAAVAVPGEEYQVKSDPIMCWETYQDRAVAQKHFDQLKADGCNTQFRVIYTAPIASAEEAVPTAADILANQMQFGADMAAKYSRVCRELAALKAVAPDEDFVKRALATYNSEYCLQRAAGVGGGEAELIAMTKVLSTHPSAAQPSRAEVLETWRPIETAPKTGGTLLLGYPNVLGKWCTVRGQWMSEAYIAENWEEPDDAEAGWYETSAEADDVPNCWLITPTHWIPLPPAPETKP